MSMISLRSLFERSSLEERARMALSSFQGSPLHKRSKVTRFLADFMGWENEHVMHHALSQPLYVQGKTDVISLTIVQRSDHTEYTVIYGSEQDATDGLVQKFLNHADDSDLTQMIVTESGLDEDEPSIRLALQGKDSEFVLRAAIDHHGIDYVANELLGEVTLHSTYAVLGRHEMTASIPIADAVVVSNP